MSQETKQIRILSRVDDKENWIEENPLLLNREIGYERETGNFKIGDGNTFWNELPYVSSSVGIATSQQGEIFNDYENNDASGKFSHAEGSYTSASGYASHAEGEHTTAFGIASHVEGEGCIASGDYSHVEGFGTVACGANQHVQGKYNIIDADDEGNPLNTYADIVGNGKSDTKRSNAYTLDWNGNAWFAGDIQSSLNNWKILDNTATYPLLSGPLKAPLYVGTFQPIWDFEKWYYGEPPYIELYQLDEEGNEYSLYAPITEIFSPSDYDIVISPTDYMIVSHGEAMAEAGIQILSNGTIYFRDEETIYNNLWDVAMDVNITVYYIGKGVI